MFFKKAGIRCNEIFLLFDFLLITTMKIYLAMAALIFSCATSIQAQTLSRQNFNAASGNANNLTYAMGDVVVMNSTNLGVGSQPGEGITTAVADELLASPHQLYPNPFKTEIVIQLGIAFQNATVEIHDFTGRLVQTIYMKENVQTLDLRSLPDGMYFAEIIVGKSSSIHKIIKTSL